MPLRVDPIEWIWISISVDGLVSSARSLRDMKRAKDQVDLLDFGDNTKLQEAARLQAQANFIMEEMRLIAFAIFLAMVSPGIFQPQILPTWELLSFGVVRALFAALICLRINTFLARRYRKRIRAMLPLTEELPVENLERRESPDDREEVK